MHLVLCLGGLPLLPLDFGPARGVGAPLGIRLGRAGSLPLLLLLREEEERELPARCRRPFPASPSLWTLPNSHCTFHDVGIRVDVAVALALAPLPVRGQEVEGVGSGHRPRRSLLVPAHAVSGRGLLTATARGLLTATARGVEALGRVMTGLDPRTDTGHAVTALDVSGRGRLTATARVVSERIPLPAGERGVTARGRLLSPAGR